MLDTSLKVLIVEDDLSSQQYYSVIFEGNYEICIVAIVAEAKQALKDDDFGVAIVDISLPGFESGIDLIRYLNHNFTDKPSLIVVTANAFPENRVQALEAGATEFFTKPIMSSILLDAVGKYMKRINSTMIP